MARASRHDIRFISSSSSRDSAAAVDGAQYVHRWRQSVRLEVWEYTASLVSLAYAIKMHPGLICYLPSIRSLPPPSANPADERNGVIGCRFVGDLLPTNQFTMTTGHRRPKLNWRFHKWRSVTMATSGNEGKGFLNVTTRRPRGQSTQRTWLSSTIMHDVPVRATDTRTLQGSEGGTTSQCSGVASASNRCCCRFTPSSRMIDTSSVR